MRVRLLAVAFLCGCGKGEPEPPAAVVDTGAMLETSIVTDSGSPLDSSAPEAAVDAAPSCDIPERATCPSETASTMCGPRIIDAGCAPPWKLECPKLASDPVRVLVYNKETEWFHPSTCPATKNVETCAKALGWTVEVSSDPAVFTGARLAGFDVVLFLQTSGNGVFGGNAGRNAFQDWIASGKGWAGTHSASHTEYDWPWFVSFVGATFNTHPDVLLPSAVDPNPCDPITAGLPKPWIRCDEQYHFTTNPADDKANTILLSLDVDCPAFPAGMRHAPTHPLAWKRNFGGGRAFYTSLGHTPESWFDTPFLHHVLAGTAWAAGKLK